MFRAIELGKKALGSAAPNPMVGCVIVHNKKIIGEGYTSPYGGSHAEVNAIESVKDKSLLSKSELYVTLEPCSHHGKTPPCADLIIKHTIPSVSIGLKDPNPKVAGAGIKRLERNGCKVKVGVLEAACREHHKRFLSFQERKRPYIILKWAETKDSFIAPDSKKRSQNPQPFWITNVHSRQLVHQWRSEEMAIMVGTNTVLEDNPKLNVREWTGKSPVRIILDRELKIPESYHVYDGSVKTIIITEKKGHMGCENLNIETLSFEGEVAKKICEVLFKHEINSVIIEGGARTLQTFIDDGLWDEARVFESEVLFKSGIKAPSIKGNTIEQIKIGENELSLLKND